MDVDFFNARHFAAVLGGFVQPDPMNAGADIMHPQSWNAYAYVLGNPLGLVDPSGMNCITLDDGRTADDGKGTACPGSQDPDQINVDGGGLDPISTVGASSGSSAGSGGSTGLGGGGGAGSPPKTGTQTASKIGSCLVKGAVVGAAGAAVVAGVVLAAPALGVSAAAISTGLFVAGAIGGAATAVSTYQNIQNHNYAAVAFSVGSLGGGLAVGGLTGGAIGDAINAPATRGFWSFGRDKANLFDPRKGLDLGKFMATGPDAAAAAGATGAAASSTSFLGRLLGGC